MPANVASKYSDGTRTALKELCRKRLAPGEHFYRAFATDHALCGCATHESSSVPVTMVGAKRERYGTRYRCLACGQVWRAHYAPLDD